MFPLLFKFIEKDIVMGAVTSRKLKSFSENERADIARILKLVEKYDHSRNEVVKKAAELQDLEFNSEYGEMYLDRIKGIVNDDEQSRTCILCKKKGAKNRIVCTKCMKKYEGPELNPVNRFAEKIDGMVGGDGYINMNWKVLFENLFKKHTAKEAEELFICGTALTTPDEETMCSDWPKPWLYGRVFIALLIASMVSFLVFAMGVTLMVPTALFVGAMLVPVSMLVMFFELNVPRNISIFYVSKVFLIGGVASILLTALFLIFDISDELTIGGAIIVGIREEIAKLIVVVHYLKKRSKDKDKRNYLLNGLLIGAAVGAGFAVFESAGYAMDSMTDVMATTEEEFTIHYSFFSAVFITNLRAMLAPGAHIVWAALSGYATVFVCEKKGYKLSSFFSRKFWALFSIPVALHAIWDMPLFYSGLLEIIKDFILVFIIWIAMIVLIDNGLDEINIIVREGFFRKKDTNESLE